MVGGAGPLHMKHGGDFVEEPQFHYTQWSVLVLSDLQRYAWPDIHLEYMRVQAADHGCCDLLRGVSSAVQG